MENKWKKIPTASIILLLIGVGLILFGIIYPNVKFKSKNTFEVDTDRRTDSVTYTLEIVSSELLDESSGKLVIDGEEYDITITKATSDNHNYELKITLYGWENVSMLDESKIKFSAETLEGKKVTFTQDNEIQSRGLKIVATVAPIMFGVFFIMAGIISGVAISKSKEIGSAVSKVIVGDEKNAGIVDMVKEKFHGTKPKQCEYCGCENATKNLKCSECGAPLKGKS